MKIKREIYEKIIYSCPVVPPEVTGAIGGSIGIIDTVVFDAGKMVYDFAVYTPDVSRLNKAITQWQRKGISFYGLFHCHPKGQETLSQNDIQYINTVMLSMPHMVTWLYFPIVIPETRIIFYKAKNQNHNISVTCDNIEIVL